MKALIPYMNDWSRRAFVTRAAGAFLGVSLTPMLRNGYAADPAPGAPGSAAASIPAGAITVNPTHAATATSVIYFYLAGGMSHLDTFDPKSDPSVMGATKAIKTNADGVQLTDYFPLLAKQMDKCAVIRSLTTKQGAHERGNYFMHTSYTPLATIRHPAMGSWAVRLGAKPTTTMPANILIGGGSNHPGAGFLESRYAPLPLGDPTRGVENSKLPVGVTDKILDDRLALTDKFDSAFRQRYPQKQVDGYTDFYRDAVKLMRGDDLKAFDLTLEKPEMRAAYGEKPVGQGALLARRLVQHGARFVEIYTNGWDTHADNFDRLEDLTEPLDKALSALLQDLAAQGLLKTTLVVVATEFGRTPKINGNSGRDHHPRVFSGLLAGGGIKGGMAYGKSDSQGFAVAENGVEVPDFNATIAYALGLSLDQKVISDIGRPFTVANKGKPITSLFA